MYPHARFLGLFLFVVSGLLMFVHGQPYLLAAPQGETADLYTSRRQEYGVVNTAGVLVDGPDLIVLGEPVIVTPLPVAADTAVTFEVTLKNQGNTDINNTFFADIFINPAAVEAMGIPLSESDGFVAVNGLAAGESATVSIQAANGFSLPDNSFHIYAMADTADLISESNELNNISIPLISDGATLLGLKYTYLPLLAK